MRIGYHSPWSISTPSLNYLCTFTPSEDIMGPRNSTRGSAIAERPLDALCQLKSCHLLRNYTTIEKSHLKGLRIQDHSRSSAVTLFDRSYICSYWWSVVTTSLSPFPRYYHFYSVHDCMSPWEVFQFQFRYDGWNYRSEVTYAFRFVFKHIEHQRRRV